MSRTVLLVPFLLVACQPAEEAPGASEGEGWRVPAHALEVAPDTYWIGVERDVDGTEIEGYAFVHRVGPDLERKKPGTGGSTTCYAVLARGARWKVYGEPFSVDESASPITGMTELMGSAVQAWETSAAADVYGSGTQDDTYDANLDTVDDENGAEFGPIAESQTIAVTYTWGVFGGPTNSRRLVEWDQIYSDSFSWNTDGNALDMDFLNIATHEVGHALGLGHPSSTCTEETMYAYATEGETKKRDLNAGDIAGINSMY